MSRPEFVTAVDRYLSGQGWTTSSTRVRDGIRLLGGERKTSTGSDRVVVMAVTAPEERVTTAHLDHLVEVGRDHGVGRAFLTADVEIPTATEAAADERGIEIVDADAIRAGSSDDPDEYEIYPARLRMLLYSLGGAALTVGSAAILSAGLADSLYTTLVAMVGVPLFGLGTLVMLYRAVDNAPVIRIDDSGIRYKEGLRSDRFVAWEDVAGVGRATVDHRGGTTTVLQVEVAEIGDEKAWQRVGRELDKRVTDDRADAHYVPIESYGVAFDEVAEAVGQYSSVPIRGPDAET